ncbi:MAG: bifunctional precorrin-2 dehydrogenase/sirohydrochlorin ferrochelatase [Armatimonadota bacterium]
MLDLTEKSCLIVGGGEIALRKAKSLLEAGARVTVISPEVLPELEHLTGVSIIHRPYQPGDVSGYTLVFSATDDHALNNKVADEASRNGVPVNVVDDPELCSFIVPSLVRRGDLMIATTSSGKSPSLSKKIRQELEERYGPEYALLADLMGEARAEVKAKYESHAEREAAFSRLLDGGILRLLREGRTQEAREMALQCI